MPVDTYLLDAATLLVDDLQRQSARQIEEWVNIAGPLRGCLSRLAKAEKVRAPGVEDARGRIRDCPREATNVSGIQFCGRINLGHGRAAHKAAWSTCLKP